MAIGKVIKGEGAPEGTSGGERPVRPARGGVVNAEVFEAHQSAAGIVAEARRKAEELVEAARRERDRVYAEAKESGRQEGLAQVTELKARALLDQKAMVKDAEREAVALALRVAEKIIGRDLQRDPKIILDICATAIENAKNARQLVIRLNPRDAAILRDHRRELLELIGRVKDISIKEDSDIQSGGCIVETDTGVIDAQLHTQFAMLERVLLANETKRKEPK